MDIDKLTPMREQNWQRVRFGSLMDIDKLTLGLGDNRVPGSFGSLMDIDKLTHTGKGGSGIYVLVL